MSCQTPDPRVSIHMEHYQHIEIVAGVSSKGLISAQTRCTLSRCRILPNQVARRCHRLLWNFEHRLAQGWRLGGRSPCLWRLRGLSSVLCCSGQKLGLASAGDHYYFRYHSSRTQKPNVSVLFAKTPV
jgi:hypothetical protein